MLYDQINMADEMFLLILYAIVYRNSLQEH